MLIGGDVACNASQMPQGLKPQWNAACHAHGWSRGLPRSDRARETQQFTPLPISTMAGFL